VKCENCGNEYAPSGDDNRCPFCGRIPGMNIGPASEAANGADEAKARGNCAWERRSSWFDLQAIIEMIRNVLVDPVATFKQMKLSGDMASPLVFVLVLGSVGVIISLFWHILLEGFQYLPFRRGVEEFVISTGMKIVFMVFSPVLVLIGTFIGAGILHISLLITGGEKNGFEATFRVVAYSSGATALFQILPICGGFIGGIWAIVAQVIGAREMHETTTGKAVLAVLLPLICCCGCIIGLSIFFGFGAFFIHNATK
jgi:hypothetical protein